MKASAIILFKKNKKILLQHRSDDAPNAPGKWGFFGGGIKNNETPKEAVVRECYEELNYNVGEFAEWLFDEGLLEKEEIISTVTKVRVSQIKNITQFYR